MQAKRNRRQPARSQPRTRFARSRSGTREARSSCETRRRPASCRSGNDAWWRNMAASRLYLARSADLARPATTRRKAIAHCRVERARSEVSGDVLQLVCRQTFQKLFGRCAPGKPTHRSQRLNQGVSLRDGVHQRASLQNRRLIPLSRHRHQDRNLPSTIQRR